jgi:hypothetical protein
MAWGALPVVDLYFSRIRGTKMDTKIFEIEQGVAVTADLSQQEPHVEVVDLKVFCCFFR